MTCNGILLLRRVADGQLHLSVRFVLLLAVSLASFLPLLSLEHSLLSTSLHGSSYKSDRIGHRMRTVM